MVLNTDIAGNQIPDLYGDYQATTIALPLSIRYIYSKAKVYIGSSITLVSQSLLESDFSKLDATPVFTLSLGWNLNKRKAIDSLQGEKNDK